MIEFEIIQKALDDYDRNIWQDMKSKSIEYIEHFREKSKCIINFNKINHYILIIFLADTHFGHDGVDYTEAEKQAKSIAGCPSAYGIDVGDSTDNFINPKILEAIINSDTTPKQQIKLFQTFIDMFDGHYVLAVSGNHNDWSKKATGVDWLAEFMKKNNIVYNRAQLKITFRLNNIDYSGKIRHKYKNKSMYNNSHGMQQNQRFNSSEIFDFFVGAHNHEGEIKTTRAFGQLQTYMQTGTFKIADPYAFDLGYEEGHPDMPGIILSPFEKRLIPVFDVETGILLVNALNKELP
jgi:hypothetical protein